MKQKECTDAFLKKNSLIMSCYKLAFHLMDIKVVCIPWWEADSVLFIQVWVNPLLRWNVSDYGGITEINIDADKLWKPDIYLYNK